MKKKHILAIVGLVFLYLVAVAFLCSGTQTKTADAPYLIVAGWIILAIAVILTIIYNRKKKKKLDKEEHTDERT